MLDISGLNRLSATVRGEFTAAIAYEGAKAAESVIKAAAARVPRSNQPTSKNRRLKRWAHLADSIITYRRKKKYIFSQAEADMKISLLVGASKRAPHAYWQEHGWKMPLGPRTRTYAKYGALARDYKQRINPLTGKPYPGRPMFNRRRQRNVGGAAHSQQGLERYKEIPGKHWFSRIEQTALQAARDAMTAKAKQLMSGITRAA